MFELRSYQIDIANQAVLILQKLGLVYLAMQPRTGKSLTSMRVAELYGAKNVLVLTKLKAIASIQGDYNNLRPNFRITVHNYESIHKLRFDFDLVICDESHCFSSFPKPSQRAQQLKERCYTLPIIYLSATPSAESFSQLYHQFWISARSPFIQYPSFYKFAHQFVNIKKRLINGFHVNDYSDANQEEIMALVQPYMISFSQAEAGFTSVVEEQILTCPIDSRLYKLMGILKRDKVYKMKSGDVIVADTPVRMQSIFHQLSSGTIITGEGKEKKYHIIDKSKAYFIKSKFAGQKICIFYQFISEGTVLREVFPNHTDVPEVFNSKSDITFICQYVTGKEGTNVSSADAIVAYNIGFSATTYYQFKERMQTLARVANGKLFWIFSEKGLERFVYKAVVAKKSFTTSYFKTAVKHIGE